MPPMNTPATPEASDFIENRTYDEIKVGDTSVLTRTLRPEDIQLFAIMSGDACVHSQTAANPACAIRYPRPMPRRSCDLVTAPSCEVMWRICRQPGM